MGIDVPNIIHWPFGEPGQEMVESSYDATYPDSVTGRIRG